MNKIRKCAAYILLGLFAGMFLQISYADDAKTSPQVIPAGTLLRVKLTTTLTSKTNKTGDRFTGQVAQAVVVGGKGVIPQGTLVEGHITFVKPAKRVKGVAQMRLVLDNIIVLGETEKEDKKISLNAGLEEANAGCAKTVEDKEGTIKGCGKDKKDAAKDAALGGAVGAGAGASVGISQIIACEYYGACGGPGMGTTVAAGAGIGAGSALIYNLLKHEKPIVLVNGTILTFMISRSVPVNAETSPNSTPLK